MEFLNRKVTIHVPAKHNQDLNPQILALTRAAGGLTSTVSNGRWENQQGLVVEELVWVHTAYYSHYRHAQMREAVDAIVRELEARGEKSVLYVKSTVQGVLT